MEFSRSLLRISACECSVEVGERQWATRKASSKGRRLTRRRRTRTLDAAVKSFTALFLSYSSSYLLLSCIPNCLRGFLPRRKTSNSPVEFAKVLLLAPRHYFFLLCLWPPLFSVRASGVRLATSFRNAGYDCALGEKVFSNAVEPGVSNDSISQPEGRGLARFSQRKRKRDEIAWFIFREVDLS